MEYSKFLFLLTSREVSEVRSDTFRAMKSLPPRFRVSKVQLLPCVMFRDSEPKKLSCKSRYSSVSGNLPRPPVSLVRDRSMCVMLAKFCAPKSSKLPSKAAFEFKLK